MLLDSILLNTVAVINQSTLSILSIQFKTTSQIVTVYVEHSGSPTILWTWADDTTSSAANPGAKDFGSAATRYHTLTVDDWSLLTRLDMDITASVEFDLIQLKTKALKGCNLYLGNTSVTGNIANLPTGLTGTISLYSTSVTGDIANLPTGLTGNLYLGNTSVTGDIANLPTGLTGNTSFYNTSVTGDIANLPTGLTGTINLGDTSVTDYSALSWPLSTGNSKTVNFTNLSGLSQSEVDSILDDLDVHGSTNGTLNLPGTSIPSAAGLTSKANLEGKGWTVTVDS